MWGRNDGRPEKYSGPPRLLEKELEVDYGRRWHEGLVIFIEHMNDLFAGGVPDRWIHQIIAHCRRYPGNQYVWQTKNPVRALSFMPFTNNDVIGTTI
jgi:protein gp37